MVVVVMMATSAFLRDLRVLGQQSVEECLGQEALREECMLSQRWKVYDENNRSGRDVFSLFQS